MNSDLEGKLPDGVVYLKAKDDPETRRRYAELRSRYVREVEKKYQADRKKDLAAERRLRKHYPLFYI